MSISILLAEKIAQLFLILLMVMMILKKKQEKEVQK